MSKETYYPSRCHFCATVTMPHGVIPVPIKAIEEYAAESDRVIEQLKAAGDELAKKLESALYDCGFLEIAIRDAIEVLENEKRDGTFSQRHAKMIAITELKKALRGGEDE